jgi:hypothetical protein
MHCYYFTLDSHPFFQSNYNSEKWILSFLTYSYFSILHTSMCSFTFLIPYSFYLREFIIHILSILVYYLCTTLVSNSLNLCLKKVFISSLSLMIWFLALPFTISLWSLEASHVFLACTELGSDTECSGPEFEFIPFTSCDPCEPHLDLSFLIHTTGTKSHT